MMVLRFAIGLVVLALIPASAGATEDDPHIRILQPDIKLQLAAAVTQSETLQALVARVEDASVRVYVDCDFRMPSAYAARLNFLTSVAGVRYVRVAIRCSLTPSQLLPILAHELQHALEIAESTSIVDADSMEAYYEDIGFPSSFDGTHRSYETEAARKVQSQVQRELLGRRLPPNASQ